MEYFCLKRDQKDTLWLSLKTRLCRLASAFLKTFAVWPNILTSPTNNDPQRFSAPPFVCICVMCVNGMCVCVYSGTPDV